MDSISLFTTCATTTQPAARYTEGMTVWPAWKVEQDWTRGYLFAAGGCCVPGRGRSRPRRCTDWAYDDGQITDIIRHQSADSFVAQWSRPSRAEDVRVYVLYDAFRTGSRRADQLRQLYLPDSRSIL